MDPFGVGRVLTRLFSSPGLPAGRRPTPQSRTEPVASGAFGALVRILRGQTGGMLMGNAIRTMPKPGRRGRVSPRHPLPPSERSRGWWWSESQRFPHGFPLSAGQSPGGWQRARIL